MSTKENIKTSELYKKAYKTRRLENLRKGNKIGGGLGAAAAAAAAAAVHFSFVQLMHSQNWVNVMTSNATHGLQSQAA
eukprot:4724649-Amphidinium_carterae.1